MGNTRKRNKTESSWRLKHHERTLNAVLSKYKHNRPFLTNLIVMFEYFSQSCMLLWNCEKAIHIFFNYNPAYSEMHYYIIPPCVSDEKSVEEIQYTKCTFESYEDVASIIKLIRGSDKRAYERGHEISRIRKLNRKETNELSKISKNHNIKIHEDLLFKSEPFVLIMDDIDGNLGCLLLYGQERMNQKSSPFSTDISSENAVINWSKYLSKFLEQQAGITPETYLPGYRQRHSTQAAVLFGDITNFTQLSRMLRIIQSTKKMAKVEELGAILQQHCCRMSQIINDCKGRIERIIGDGVMAIFGEHQENPVIAVGNAVAAATKMVNDFRNQRKNIQERIFGQSDQNEINEMIELDYSVGINYGTVLFDYLGDEQHREYSCIGDHVSFADRLMRKAARFDTDTNEKWPPILISQTAEQYLKYWIGSDIWEEKKKEARRILHAKGYGFPSYVYGLETHCFNLEKYRNIMGPIWKKEKTESEFVDLLTRSYVKNEPTKR